MTRRSNEGDTITVQVINRITHRTQLKIAGIAAAGVKMTYMQRASQLCCDCLADLHGTVSQNLRQSIMVRMHQRLTRAGLYTATAENALTVIYFCFTVSHAHSSYRAGSGTGTAAVAAAIALQLTAQTLVARSINIFGSNLSVKNCLQHF